MVLDAENRVLPVLHAHDEPIVGFARDVEAFRAGGALDDEAVVAGRDKGARHARVDIGSLMVNF